MPVGSTKEKDALRAIKSLQNEVRSLRYEITKLNEILRVKIPNYEFCRTIRTINE